MSNILVSGATGFIGSKLVKNLSLSGHKVIALSSNREKAFNEFRNFDVEIIDWNSEPFLKPEIFIHLAWENSSGPLRGNWESQLDNIQLLLRSIHLASRLGVKRFVGIGTITELEAIQVRREDNTNPAFVYGHAKDLARKIGQLEAHVLSMEFQWLRLGNIYGLNDNTGRFFIRTLGNLVENVDMDLTDGMQLSDFIYESDALEAIELAVTRGRKDSIYYIGAGAPLQLRSAVELMRKLSRSRSRLNFGAVPSNGITLKESQYSIDSLTRDTGYKPLITLEQGIKLVVQSLK